MATAMAWGLVGCGEPSAKTVTGGEMPPGETWKGVYFHPVYGNLHMVEAGENVVGRWKHANQSAWGELSGTKSGNVLTFTWKEHKVGLVGAAAESHGRGHFQYAKNDDNIPILTGEYGLNDDDSGSSWNCVKQLNVPPDLKSVSGDTGGLAPAAAGKWD